MAAGQGYKEFSTGDILTAADANGYLASQVVMVFADAAARTSAIASPQEGMITYLKDTNSTEYYSGSAWVAISGGSSAPASNSDFVSTQESTTSATYTTLTTGQSVTLTTGTKVLVIVGGRLNTTTAEYGAFMSYDISGATTSSASDDYSVNVSSSTANDADQSSYVSYRTVTAGSNTFTAKFRAESGTTARFAYRTITVIDLGS